ncbi:hypothetical protein ACWEFD_02905 [Streptomyces ardesiacus]
MSFINPRLPGLNSDDVVTDITESPHRVGAVVQAGGAQVIATVDVQAGEDDWNAPPSEEHPRPVVLVHGTFGNRGYTWNTATPPCCASTGTGSSGSTTASTAIR